MIDIAQGIREAIYTCLNGVTYSGDAVPVVYGFHEAEALSNHHIIIDNITDNSNDSLSHIQSEVNATVQIVTFVDGSYRVPVDTIASSVRGLLQPTLSTNGLTISGAQVLNLRVTSPQGYLEEVDERGTIIRKILNINFTINHN